MFIRSIFIITLVIGLAALVGGSLMGAGEMIKGAEKQVAESPEDICPVLIGETLPKMMLKSVDGQPFDLNAAVSEKPAVLIVYRGGW